jgi:hypothetical protein
MSKLAEIIKEEFEKYATDNRQRFDLRFLSSPLVLKHVSIISGKESIFDIRDEEIIKQIYQSVLTDVDNINAHQNYSAAVLHYRKFISLKISVKKK